MATWTVDQKIVWNYQQLQQLRWTDLKVFGNPIGSLSELHPRTEAEHCIAGIVLLSAKPISIYNSFRYFLRIRMWCAHRYTYIMCVLYTVCDDIHYTYILPVYISMQRITTRHTHTNLHSYLYEYLTNTWTYKYTMAIYNIYIYTFNV